MYHRIQMINIDKKRLIFIIRNIKSEIKSKSEQWQILPEFQIEKFKAKIFGCRKCRIILY